MTKAKTCLLEDAGTKAPRRAHGAEKIGGSGVIGAGVADWSGNGGAALADPSTVFAGAAAAITVSKDAAASGGTTVSSSTRRLRPSPPSSDTLPPMIPKPTRMTRRIRNLYGDRSTADKVVSCQYCSRGIELGASIRRASRREKVWHNECYQQARGAGQLPPRLEKMRTMTKRIQKLFGNGRPIACSLCDARIRIGSGMRRMLNSDMCWHESCYRLTWGGTPRFGRRPAYILSNVKWGDMVSKCAECVGSRLCRHHQYMEKMYRVPKPAANVDAAATAAAAA